MEDDKLLFESSPNKVQQEQVLEYYTKYSLNPELPKYFCGSSSFQISDWSSTPDERYNQLETKNSSKGKAKSSVAARDNISKNPKIILNDGQTDCNVVPSSPASSVASNRKLEWDNGADIGYNNVVHRTLQKSISLPILNKFEYKELQDRLLGRPSLCERIVEVTQIPTEHSNSIGSSGEVEEGFLPITSSSSSSAVLQHRTNSGVSSSTSPLQPQLSSDSNSGAIGEVSRFIQKQIGDPVAESTPFNLQKSANGPDRERVRGLPSVHRSFSIDINMADKISHYKHFKMLKLSASKPVLVECIRNLNALKNFESKFIQTSLIRNVSIGLQTDSSLFVQKVLKPKPSEQQSIFYMYHSDSDAERIISSSSQTDNSEMLSNHCQSFEFVFGDDLNDKTTNNLWRCPPKSDLTSLPPDLMSSLSPQLSDNSLSSSHSPLAQLLTSHESNHRIPDFQKKVRLLQKMLSSCKYNDSTKKFYLKRVLKKMFDTRYSDDTTCEHSKIDINKVSSRSNNKDEDHLQQNKPWTPIHPTKTLQVQTFSNEILPQEAIKNHFVPIQKVRRSRNRLLTLTNKEPVNPVINNDVEDEDKMTPLFPLSKTETSSLSPNNLTSTSQPSSTKTWRDNKTRSEQILEEMGDGDSVPQKLEGKGFEEDLAWINKEILHLNKLKKKLKQNKMENNVIEAVLHEPHTEDLKGLKQTTTVYVLTTETAKEFCNKCTPQTCTNPQCAGYQSIRRTNSVCRCIRHLSPHRNQQCQNCTGMGIDTDTTNQLRPFPSTSEYRRNSSPSSYLPRKSEQIEPPLSRIESMQRSISMNTESRFTKELGQAAAPLPSSSQTRAEPRLSKDLGQVTAPFRQSTARLSEQIGTSRSKTLSPTIEKPHEMPLSSNVETSKSSTSKSSVRSYTLEISMEPSTKKKQTDEKNTCTCPCITQKFKPYNLVQQLVCTESIEGDKVEKTSNDQHVQCWIDVSEDVGKQKCTCCPACLKKVDKRLGDANGDKVTTKEKSTESSNENFARYMQGNIKEGPSNNGNKAIRTVSNSTMTRGSNLYGGSKSEAQSQTMDALQEGEISSRMINEDTCANKQLEKEKNDTSNKKKRDSISDGIPDWKKSNKLTQTSSSLLKKPSQHSTSTSTNSSTISSSSSSVTQLCLPIRKNACKCCNRQVEISSAPKNNSNYGLCHPCYNQNRQTPYYTYPGHVCKCYAETTQILQEVRDTVKELNMLEQSNYCSCRNSVKQRDSDYCIQCSCKVKDKHSSKKGIAYMLTLEPDDQKHKKSRRHRKPSLEEIKVKVPSYSSNRHKKHSTSSSDEGYDKENSAKKKHKQRKNSHKKKLGKKTLQDYLFVNKPDFIASAEQRRLCLIDLAYVREQRCLKYKQLLAALADLSFKNGIPFQNLTPNNQKSGPKHLFTAAEMKQITAKHYKTLPEVQQKLVDHREEQVKKANKLLTDIFNHKLRQQTLRGKLTIPTTTSIIKLD